MWNGCEWNPLAAIAGLAHELHFRQEEHLWIHPANITHYLPHLSHFTNVTTLIFANLVTGIFDETSLSNCFKPFIPVVRTLRIHRPITRPTSLIQIIVLFSSAVDVQISWPRWSIADANVILPPPSQEECGLTGTLQLHGFGEKWSEFFALLSTYRLGFQNVRLEGCELSASYPAQSLLEAVSQSACVLHLDGSGKRGLDFKILKKVRLTRHYLERLCSGITLQTFNVLKRLAFKMTKGGIGGGELARLLNSISSLVFSLLALDVSDREKRRTDRSEDSTTKRFLEEMKALDSPLRRLANGALYGTGKRFTLILLANDPAAVAGSFAEFQKVGNIWKGAKLIEGQSCDYYWTPMAATDSDDQTVEESVLSFVNV